MADLIPLLPSGARRAGAARVMAARIGDKPSVLVDHPLKTQLLALGLGAVGGAYTEDQGIGKRIAATVGPIALVQLLRRMELKRIQKRYDEKPRKRLRELDSEDLLDTGGWGGSSRLGAVNAYETMRKRKYQGFGSLAEAGDAIQLAAGAVSPALYVGAIPLMSGIDHRAADKLQKGASDSFSDQRNIPVIPLMLAAALGGTAGQVASVIAAKQEFGDTPAMGKENWRKMVNEISGGEPLLFASSGTRNAFYSKPRTRAEARGMLALTSHDEDLNGGRHHGIPGWAFNRDRIERAMEHGVVRADIDAGIPVLAHEAGHAKIENTPGLLRALQRHVYPHQRVIAPLASGGSMAAGLASGGTLKGALLGTLIGGVAGIGQLAPEFGASYNALKHIRGLGDRRMTNEALKDLGSAFSTYLALGVLPSTLAGAAGGYVSGRRKKKEEEEEGQRKEANAEAHALWRTAKWLREEAGGIDAESAVRTARGLLYTPTKMDRFIRNTGVANQPVGELGPKMVEMNLDPIPAPIEEISEEKSDIGDLLRLLKQGAHPALPDLIAAKAHSDKKEYPAKNRLLSMAMRRDPEAFIIDSDDGRGIVGVTHLPTGFRIHMLRHQVDPAVENRAITTGPAS